MFAPVTDQSPASPQPPGLARTTTPVRGFHAANAPWHDPTAAIPPPAQTATAVTACDDDAWAWARACTGPEEERRMEFLREVDVEVVTHSFQRTAVWFGGSVLASTPGFYSSCVTKADYEEHGASVVRQNPVFRGV